MLPADKINEPVTIPANAVTVVLHIINRLQERGGVHPMELTVVGTVRGELVAALEKAVGINFDQAWMAQVAAQREAESRAKANDEQAAKTVSAS